MPDDDETPVGLVRFDEFGNQFVYTGRAGGWKRLLGNHFVAAPPTNHTHSTMAPFQGVTFPRLESKAPSEEEIDEAIASIRRSLDECPES